MNDNPDIPEGMKRCPKCERMLPKTEFHRNRRKRDGLGFYCKGCRKEISSAWRKTNREKHNAFKRRWYKANPEKEKESRNKRSARQRKDLAPGVVKSQIAIEMRRNGIYISKSFIPEDLIQAKREQMKLARAIRALKQETRNAK